MILKLYDESRWKFQVALIMFQRCSQQHIPFSLVITGREV